MCNALNHPPGCNCGWGGVYHKNSQQSISQSKDSIRSNKTSGDKSCEKTVTTKCPWCSSNVWYHTNGYGDSVYFDNLGYPWQIHECFKKYLKNKKIDLKVESELFDESLFFMSDIKYQDVLKTKEDQQKRSILVGAAHQISGVMVGKLLIYKAREEKLANKMGLSIKELREHYGHIYTQEADGIKLFSDEQIRLIVQQGKDLYAGLSPRQKRRAIQQERYERKKARDLRRIKPVIKGLCPYCHQEIQVKHLQKHTNEKCIPVKSKQPKK